MWTTLALVSDDKAPAKTTFFAAERRILRPETRARTAVYRDSFVI
jgi:hypothetical protein